MYEYKVVSGDIELSHKQTISQVVEGILNTHAKEGWEFYAHAQVAEFIKAGCISALFGGENKEIYHQTFIFRRKKQEEK